MIDKPGDTEFAPFFAGYVSLVPETDVVAVLQDQAAEVHRHARAFSPGSGVVPLRAGEVECAGAVRSPW